MTLFESGPAKLLVAAIILLAAQALSADVLVLKNGDRISGEIKKIWDGKISIEPEYAGEIDVDLVAVERIESDRIFEIELEDGREVVGKLAGANSAGQQVIEVDEQTIAVRLTQIFELDEPEDDFDWDSNLNFSAAVNEGNTDSYNTKIRADTIVRFSDHRHIGEVTFFREGLDGVDTQNKDLFKYNYNWLFGDPWYFSTMLSYERDPIVDLDERVILSVGVGMDIWATPRRQLSAQLGVGGQIEQIALVSANSEVLSWSLRYEQEFFGGDLELYHNHSIVLNISGRDNTRFKTTTGVRFEITDLLYGNVSLDYDYETHPAEFARNEDIAILLGLGLEY